MVADAPATPCRKPASLPPLFALRARSRVADLGAGAAFSGPPDTPPRSSTLTVPFLWEDAPGKPKSSVPEGEGGGGDRQGSGHADQARPVPLKLPPRLQRVPSFAAADTLLSTKTVLQHQDSGHADQAHPVPLKLPPRLQRVPPSFAAADTVLQHQDSGHADQARPVPLKLPPRLQRVSSSFAAADTPLSPKTVLQGPYFGRAGSGRRPPRWARSAGAALRRTPSAGGRLLSPTWSRRTGSNKNRGGDRERDAAGPDAPWGSPASSSASSTSTVSTCFGVDDQGGRRGRPVDHGREVYSEEDDGSPRASVRITRLRRNRSLPSITTSNLWASIRRSVKQITPWS